MRVRLDMWMLIGQSLPIFLILSKQLSPGRSHLSLAGLRALPESGAPILTRPPEWTPSPVGDNAVIA